MFLTIMVALTLTRLIYYFHNVGLCYILFIASVFTKGKPRWMVVIILHKIPTLNTSFASFCNRITTGLGKTPAQPNKGGDSWTGT